MKTFTTQRGTFIISTDKERLDIIAIHSFLKDAYWSKNIPIDIVKKSIEGSVCFGVYNDKVQIGFARVITDLATYGYLADVFILPNFQGQGLGIWLIKTIMTMEAFKNFRSWALSTQDAHGLYAKFGFKLEDKPALRMRKVNFEVY